MVWYQTPDQLEEFRKVSDPYFTCIDRGGTFREFVPIGYSKATGIQYVLDYYHLDLDAAYAIGDSNNDLRCSLMYQTASPWEMLPRLPCLIRYLL